MCGCVSDNTIMSMKVVRVGANMGMMKAYKHGWFMLTPKRPTSSSFRYDICVFEIGVISLCPHHDGLCHVEFSHGEISKLWEVSL